MSHPAVVVVIGTRPEAIKMAPLIIELKKQNLFEVIVCNTGQHRDMIKPVLSLFGIEENYSLNVMTPNQTLSTLTSRLITELEKTLAHIKPKLVIVHGDTTTSFAASLVAFYLQIKVAHVEAGLRTENIFSPFPEEFNRSVNSLVADIHFAPTVGAKLNLLRESAGRDKNIFVTGNTVIDALFLCLEIGKENSLVVDSRITDWVDPKKHLILFTGHRRENFGDGFKNIFEAVINLLDVYGDRIQIIYPVHPNPNIKKEAYEYFSEFSNVLLTEPLDYVNIVWVISKSYFIITDSGGIQEEAPSLGKPVLVIRDTTERPEAVEAGTVKLVGSNKETILKYCKMLIDDQEYYKSMADAINPYGDGKASKRIVDILKERFL